MVALSTEGGKIPENAVILTKQEALQYQLKLIEEWQPATEVWPLRFGFGILSTLNAASALYINSHFRNKLKLGNFGRISTYLPTIILPSFTTALFHSEFVTSEVVLQAKCPVCLEIRASVIQVALGTLFPLLTAPAASLNFALRYNTYRLPSITEKPMEVFKLCQRFLKPIKGTLMYIAMFQVIAGAGMTYLEGNSVYKMHLKMIELENSQALNSNE